MSEKTILLTFLSYLASNASNVLPLAVFCKNDVFGRRFQRERRSVYTDNLLTAKYVNMLQRIKMLDSHLFNTVAP